MIYFVIIGILLSAWRHADFFRFISHIFHACQYMKQEQFNIHGITANVEDYSKVRDYIVFKLINKEANSLLLKNVPHVNYLDLAIVFYYLLPSKEDEKEKWFTIVNNELMQHWGVTVEELMQRASENTSRLLGLKIQGILSTIAEYTNDKEWLKYADMEDACIPLYVATNKENTYGASVMLYRDMLRAVAEKFNSDLYVIPCSVHEILLFRPIKGCQVDTNSLKSLISQVNRCEIPKSEVLSDSLYYYSRINNELSYA